MTKKVMIQQSSSAYLFFFLFLKHKSGTRIVKNIRQEFLGRYKENKTGVCECDSRSVFYFGIDFDLWPFTHRKFAFVYRKICSNRW